MDYGGWTFLDFAAGELEKIGLIERKDVIDGTLVRVPNAYPAYFGAYDQFGDLRTYLDLFSNLFQSVEMECTGTTTRTTRC